MNIRSGHFRSLTLLLLLLISPLAIAQSPTDYFVLHSGESVPLYPEISPDNVAEVFAYRLGPAGKVYGAKAVAWFNAEGEPSVYFFPMGKDRKFNELHHLAVLDQVLWGRTYQVPWGRTYARDDVQGFEFQAENIDGKWQVVGLDISSSITMNQVSTQRALPRERQESLLKLAQDRIHRSLRRFATPNWPKELRWKCSSDLLEPPRKFPVK